MTTTDTEYKDLDGDHEEFLDRIRQAMEPVMSDRSLKVPGSDRFQMVAVYLAMLVRDLPLSQAFKDATLEIAIHNMRRCYHGGDVPKGVH